jgi:hypothetical protein
MKLDSLLLDTDYYSLLSVRKQQPEPFDIVYIYSIAGNIYFRIDVIKVNCIAGHHFYPWLFVSQAGRAIFTSKAS